MSGFTVLPSTGASTYVPATEMPPALYLRGDGNLVTATELTRGPWAHRVMHGGGITGILGWAVDRALERPDLVCTRFTVDILSGVPVEELAVRSIVRKEGTRTAVVDASLEYDGLQVARASSQWLLGSDTPDHATTELPPVPGDRADPDAHPDMEYPRPGFNADAVDIRVLEGLGLRPINTIPIRGCSDTASLQAPTFMVRFQFASRDLKDRVLVVVGLPLARKTGDEIALLGRDILRTARFVYDGPAGGYSLEFS